MFTVAELCAELCIGPVKALVDRPRPAGSLVAVTGQSMPSGHALIAAVTAVALALILTRPGRSRRLAIAAAVAWSIFVALSRTYLSAHWLTDVLASLLLGTGWAALWFGMLAPSQGTPYPRTTIFPAREPRYGRPPAGQPSPQPLSRRGPAASAVRPSDGASVDAEGDQATPSLLCWQEASGRCSKALRSHTAGRLVRRRRKRAPLARRCCHISPRVSCALRATEVRSSRNINLVYTWINERDFLF